MSTNFYLLLALLLVFPSINPISAFAQSPFSGPSLTRSGDSLIDREPTWWKWVYTDPKTGVRFADYYGSRLVIGEVPDSLDLTDDELTKKLLTKGRDIWLYNTDYRDYDMKLKVLLYRGSFVSLEQMAGEDVFGSFRGDSSDKPLEGFTEFKTKKGNPHYIRGYELTAYSNKISNKVVEARRKAEAEAAEAKRKAEVKAKVRATASAFVKKYNVKQVVDLVDFQELFSNPFVYKGRKIAIYLRFIMMTAQNEALFSVPIGVPTITSFCLVSSVPSTAFTFKGDEYTFAVRVLGLTEARGVKSILGTELTSVPYLEYMGHESGDLTGYIAEVLERLNETSEEIKK